MFNSLLSSLPTILFYLVPIAIVFGILTIINRFARENHKSAYNYYAKSHIMTKREEEFFATLCRIFESKCYVIPQVHLSALLNHRVKGQDWEGAFRHINGKSVDYVLLRRNDLSVLCAVELDDATHDTIDRRKRDLEVDKLFQNAHIPLVRLRSPEKMSKQDIVDAFAETINSKA